MNRRMSLGNVPADVLAGAVEKLLARMDESDLAAFYDRELAAMPADDYPAFRERGESSEDAAEGAGTTLDAIARREGGAVSALLRYALGNTDLIKEATVLFIAERPQSIAALPAGLRDALTARLTGISS